jgi:hypothetical protein
MDSEEQATNEDLAFAKRYSTWNRDNWHARLLHRVVITVAQIASTLLFIWSSARILPVMIASMHTRNWSELNQFNEHNLRNMETSGVDWRRNIHHFFFTTILAYFVVHTFRLLFHSHLFLCTKPDTRRCSWEGEAKVRKECSRTGPKFTLQWDCPSILGNVYIHNVSRCMYVCMLVCMCSCVYVRMFSCVYVRNTYVYMYVLCMCVYVYVCVCVYVCICVCRYVCMSYITWAVKIFALRIVLNEETVLFRSVERNNFYVCMHVCMLVCMYVRMFSCVYVRNTYVYMYVCVCVCM